MPFNPSEPLNEGDLDLELDSLNGKTMSVRHVARGGKLRFNNKAGTKKLLIMSPAVPPPFVVHEGQTPVSWFEVPPDDKVVVRVSEAYDWDSQFTYTALIEGSGAEDPIVVVDRR